MSSCPAQFPLVLSMQRKLSCNQKVRVPGNDIAQSGSLGNSKICIIARRVSGHCCIQLTAEMILLTGTCTFQNISLMNHGTCGSGDPLPGFPGNGNLPLCLYSLFQVRGKCCRLLEFVFLSKATVKCLWPEALSSFHFQFSRVLPGQKTPIQNSCSAIPIAVISRK